MPTVSRGIKIRLHKSKQRAIYGYRIKRGALCESVEVRTFFRYHDILKISLFS